LDDDNDDDDDDDNREKEARDLNPTKQMTIEGFASFLQSADNAALHEKHTAVHQDMSLPLHDYFISTSHNVSQSLQISIACLVLSFFLPQLTLTGSFLK
jgi:hypothetical protein